jgi:hypothetical protein
MEDRNIIKESDELSMIYQYGCTANELSVNDINEIDLTDEERLVVINRIFKWYKEHKDELNNLLQFFIGTQYDDYETSDEPCECCGDYIETFKLTI